jgi:hypothetical protein
MTRDEAEQFNAQQAAPLPAAQVDELYELLAGHPQLTHRVYEALAGGLAFDDFRASAASSRGPLGDHLRMLSSRLAKRPELLAGIAQAIKQGKVADRAVAGELCSIGVLVDNGARYDPANLLYAQYFARKADG